MTPEPYDGAEQQARFLTSVLIGNTVHAANFAPPGITPAPLKADVDVTELMGNEIFLYLLSGTKSFIARVDPRTSARVGQDPLPIPPLRSTFARDSLLCGAPGY